MITRGSKYFFGAALVAYLTALIYGFITGAAAHGGVISTITDGGLVNSIIGPISFGWKGWVGEHVGYSTLMAMAASSAVIGGFFVVFRDSDAEAIIPLQGADVTPETADLRVQVPQGLSPWPILCALAAGLMVVGATYTKAAFVLGAVLLAVGTFQWTVRNWSERLTPDPARNVALRDKLMGPYNIPIAAIIGIAVVMFLMSRILLALPSMGAVFVIIASAAAVFVIAILLAGRPDLKRSVLIAALVAGGLVLLLGGIAGGRAGTYKSNSHGGEEGAPATTVLHGTGDVDANNAGLAGEY
ncbi:MAG: hypothetical protein KDB26_10220 [Microthrixaceae bacterium]|nr:hypothetical protein [Microthrixaceae bacterium]